MESPQRSLGGMKGLLGLDLRPMFNTPDGAIVSFWENNSVYHCDSGGQITSVRGSNQWNSGSKVLYGAS